MVAHQYHTNLQLLIDLSLFYFFTSISILFSLSLSLLLFFFNFHCIQILFLILILLMTFFFIFGSCYTSDVLIDEFIILHPLCLKRKFSQILKGHVQFHFFFVVLYKKKQNNRTIVVSNISIFLLFSNTLDFVSDYFIINVMNKSYAI